MRALLIILFCCSTQLAWSAQVVSHSANGEVNIKNWKTLRDSGVIKQRFDYSCGAASLATLLSGYYSLNVPEIKIINDMHKLGYLANFQDMVEVVNLYGFKGIGIALGYDKLATLTIPVVIYVRHNGQDHFSVLRGISNTNVQLADPSWGNIKLSKTQFLKIWETREDENYKGKILLITPKSNEELKTNPNFFTQPTANTLGVQTLISNQHLYRINY